MFANHAHVHDGQPLLGAYSSYHMSESTTSITTDGKPWPAVAALRSHRHGSEESETERGNRSTSRSDPSSPLTTNTRGGITLGRDGQTVASLETLPDAVPIIPH